MSGPGNPIGAFNFRVKCTSISPTDASFASEEYIVSLTFPKGQERVFEAGKEYHFVVSESESGVESGVEEKKENESGEGGAGGNAPVP
jgi:hypothetical protein